MKRSGNIFVDLDIPNPKNESDAQIERNAKVFPYYAGYASSFAEQVLRDLALPAGAVVLDPWNGSGTTMLAAARHGFCALGLDLNPVMVVAAKAALLPRCSVIEVERAATEIIKLADRGSLALPSHDPLCQWFVPSSAAHIRNIETAINLQCFSEYRSLFEKPALDQIRPPYAFLYICLFRSIRKLLKEFIPSNPTWVKFPASPSNRKRPKKTNIAKMFLNEIAQLSASLPSEGIMLSNLDKINIALGDAKKLGIPAGSIDAIITSPPYCTRIDYAIATSIELAVMGCSSVRFEEIRRSLLGNSMISKVTPTPEADWGNTCNAFLVDLFAHASHASRGYYYKTHLQYFSALKDSIIESAKVLSSRGKCIYVVQDSYYKEIRNDIAQIVIEMCAFRNLRLVQRRDFQKNNSMSVINSRARKYMLKRQTIETVLVFSKDR